MFGTEFRGQLVGQEDVIAAILLHAPGAFPGFGTLTPIEIASHHALNGPARVLRDHQPVGDILVMRPVEHEKERRAQRDVAAIHCHGALGDERDILCTHCAVGLLALEENV